MITNGRGIESEAWIVLYSMSSTESVRLIDLSIEKDNWILRTSNAEFSAKHKRFLANVQLENVCDVDDEASDSCVLLNDYDEKDADFEINSSKHGKLIRKKSVAQTVSIQVNYFDLFFVVVDFIYCLCSSR